ncbi:MFS transporter [Herbaspirillum huttiense]|uniref:MFS transporter n=1 Tax=Herbaspirillum huttiense TaxID=863372 RepID=UPI0031D63531
MSLSMGRSPAVALRYLMAIQLLSMGAMEMSGPFWPLHLREMAPMSAATLAWVSMAVYAGPLLMTMLTAPWWGRLGDRTGHKPMVVRALLALAVSQLMAAWTDSVTVVLLARLIQGALGGFIATAQAYGAGLATPAQRSSLMARLQVATAMGSALGPWLGGILFDLWGFWIVNLTTALVCVLCALLAAVALPFVKPAAPTDRQRASSKPVAPTAAERPALQAFQGLLLGILLVQAGKIMPQAFFAVYADQVLHANASFTGLCYGATALGLCIAAPLWARAFAALAPEQVLQRVKWITLACAATLALQSMSHVPAWFVAARLLWGVFLGALLPVFYTLLSRQADGHRQGWVLGAGNSAAKAGALLGTAAGALAMGWLPISEVFWPNAAVYLIVAAALHGLQRRSDTREVAS